MRTLLLLLPLLMQPSTPLPGPSQAQGPGSSIGTVSRPNVLLILVDDLGVEHVKFHPVGRATGNPARTTYLNSLANQSIVYTDFYATPICSATRASLLTGRHPFRHGVGRRIVQGEPGLDTQEITLAEQLAQDGYRTAAFGKWHISFDRDNPTDQGFELFDGSLLNLSGGGGSGYYQWVRTRNGKSWTSQRYATSATTDAAAAWIRQREDETPPWFAFVAYHAPHGPFEPPPAQLNPFTKAQAGDPTLVIYHGMVEALDREIARLMREVDLSDTLVIFVGDNGSPSVVAQGPVVQGKAKHTAYEGGIRVPAMIAGAGMSQTPGEYGGVVHIVDLFNTILDYTDAPRVDPQTAVLDSVSLCDPALPADARWLPNRGMLFTERFGPNGKQPNQAYAFLWRSVRGPRYKLLQTLSGDQLYDLWTDPWELNDLTQGFIDPALMLEYRALDARIDELVDN
jgi:arylsulfatase A-like enzyme